MTGMLLVPAGRAVLASALSPASCVLLSSYLFCFSLWFPSLAVLAGIGLHCRVVLDRMSGGGAVEIMLALLSGGRGQGP